MNMDSITGSAGTRTRNQRLKRALLYRLSYRPIAIQFLIAAKFFNLEPTPKAFGAALPIELPTRAGLHFVMLARFFNVECHAIRRDLTQTQMHFRRGAKDGLDQRSGNSW